MSKLLPNTTKFFTLVTDPLTHQTNMQSIWYGLEINIWIGPFAHPYLHIVASLFNPLGEETFFVLEAKNEFTPWLSFSALFPHKLRSPEIKKVLDQSNTRKQNLFCTWSQLVRFAYIELVSPTHLLLEVRRGTCLGFPTHTLRSQLENLTGSHPTPRIDLFVRPSVTKKDRIMSV